MKKMTVVFFILVFAIGCVKQVQLRNNISQAELDAQKVKTGSNSITGNAFLKRNDGIAVTCAGSAVHLMPVIPYTTEMVNEVYGVEYRGLAKMPHPKNAQIKNIDPKLNQITMTTMCNSDGYFKFKNVPDGEYYVVTKVVWNPSGDAFGQQGGGLMRKISISGNEEHEVIMTR